MDAFKEPSFMKKPKRIVIKVGTATLCRANNTLNLRRIDRLARVISDLKNEGLDVVLVSSGAIGAGVSRLGLSARPEKIEEKQAAAAIGQCELMSIYDRFFQDYGYMSAQVLVTKDVTEQKTGRRNVIATLNTLLKMHAVPIVNENDTVATEEIVYGDNDTLSAVIAQFVKADLLIILSDIDGLYDKDPSQYRDARMIHVVRRIDRRIEAMAKGSHTGLGTGGMITKLHAAKIAAETGIPCVIASGDDPEIVYEILDGKERGTRFLPGTGE
jgi:glutamate 5-kinase